MFRRICVSTQQKRFAATTSSTLKKPQYDFKSLRENTQLYHESVIRRQVKLSSGLQVHEVVEKYNQLIQAQRARNDLVHQRNQIQKQIEQSPKSEDKKTFIEQLGPLKKEIKASERQIAELEPPVMSAVESIPNLIADDVTDEEQLVDMIHRDRKSDVNPEMDHLNIALRLGMVDFEAASRVSGSSWYYLLNDGALLEQALVQYGLSKARQHGFSMITPPSIVRQEITNACGFKPRDNNNEQQVYLLENGNLCLTGTAEIPLAGWAAHRTLDLTNGPLKKVGVSRSYRAEAGAGGKDTKGLYRVHEFTKVELFCWTKDSIEDSSNVLEQLLNLQKEMISELGLCARVLNMPSNDLGAPAYKKYDIEAWMPGRGGWGEVTSTSNCLDYQSRRMHTKYALKDGTSSFAYTLNGTAVAVPRLMVAIIENFYDPANDRIVIPEPLRPWMDNREFITAP